MIEKSVAGLLVGAVSARAFLPIAALVVYIPRTVFVEELEETFSLTVLVGSYPPQLFVHPIINPKILSLAVLEDSLLTQLPVGMIAKIRSMSLSFAVGVLVFPYVLISPFRFSCECLVAELLIKRPSRLMRPSSFTSSPTASEGAESSAKITSVVRGRFFNQPPSSHHLWNRMSSLRIAGGIQTRWDAPSKIIYF